MIWTVAKKELRGYFNSAVAVIFLAAFLAVAFYTFFWQEKFFARGIADLRPLFEWMPRLLIIIVSALAMRLWADERKAGTLEVLLTLPIARWRLVLGKFVAGMALIAVALGLTLGLPLTVSHMGHLDWGPVIGGYLAALLLSAAYLSIGMCVSALTDNQIVAFIGTALVCVVAYAIGDVDNTIGRFLGTGVRFESVARGVLDVRDLAYYAGIVAVGLGLNVVLLQRLSWASGERARSRRVAAVLGVVLIAANAVALDAWLAPVRRARVDLTQSGAFSLSPSTISILNGLDEHVLIRGYFSEKTHPKIAPLIPQMRDLLDEYRIAGGGKVRVEIVDPAENDDARKEAKERFGIDATPLRFATQTEKSVVDAYFAVAIEYGDHHAVLGLDDLIQVRAVDMGDVEITLKNPEYQITKTLKKTVSQFASLDSLFASMPGKVTLTAYLTPKTLPDNWKTAPQKLQDIVDKLKKQAAGKLDYNVVEPKTDDEMKALFDKYGVRPYEDIFANSLYYFSMLVQVGDRIVRIAPPQSLDGKDLENSINEGLKRAAPGFTRIVGMWTPPELPPMGGEGMPQQPIPPPQAFKLLERALGGNYEVRPVPLFGAIPDDIEVMVVAGPADLGEDQAKAIDQFVMRGGALVVLDGRYRLAQGGGLAIEKVQSGLDKLLGAWGITVGDDVVLDTKAEKLPIPVEESTDAGMMRTIFDNAYPFFIRLDGDELAPNLITEGLAGAIMHWASPVKAEAKVGDDTHVVEPLLTSSSKSWLRQSPKAMPDPATYPKTGFPGPDDLADDKKGPQVLAVAITGGFTSAFAPDKPGSGSGSAAGSGSGSAEHLIRHSPPDTRIVVFGSSAFASDDMQQLSQQLESELGMADLELVHNAVDWSLADTDLLAIRSRNNGAAHAITIDPDSAGSWRDANLIIAALLLAGVIGFAWFRRRAVRPVVDPTVPVVKKEGA